MWAKYSKNDECEGKRHITAVFLQVSRKYKIKFIVLYSGGSRPSPKGGGGAFEGLTINAEFCKDNSGRSKKMRYFRKNKEVATPPLDPPVLY